MFYSAIDCLFACLLAILRKKYWSDLHKHFYRRHIFGEGSHR